MNSQLSDVRQGRALSEAKLQLGPMRFPPPTDFSNLSNARDAATLAFARGLRYSLDAEVNRRAITILV